MRLVAAFLALALAAPAAAQNARLELRPGETLLEVEARGHQQSRPDVMTISAGVVTTGASAAEALRQNSILANRMIELVRSRNVGERDVRTTELRIAPRFERRPRGEDDDPEIGRRIIGYVASNRVELRLRDLGRAPELLDALLQAGANSVQGPRFSLSNERPARLAAQRDAVRLAREEAEIYADALGMRVTRVLRVSERSRSTGDGDAIIVTGSRIPAPPIEPGEIETEVRVWVDFALAPQ
jgi:uncharacterized protein YggE